MWTTVAGENDELKIATRGQRNQTSSQLYQWQASWAAALSTAITTDEIFMVMFMTRRVLGVIADSNLKYPQNRYRYPVESLKVEKLFFNANRLMLRSRRMIVINLANAVRYAPGSHIWSKVWLPRLLVLRSPTTTFPAARYKHHVVLSVTCVCF